MDKNRALSAFAALSQSTRLDAFRLLIAAGGKGMLAGEIGDALDVRQNTMSANLSVLTQAGLLRNQREGRAVRYFADLNGVRGLLGYLMEDCCGGHPELCRNFIEKIDLAC
ncbi:helix-turn-helix transcriptional regulator [Pseudoruegeria sp. HB172150]|uniref:ArsR/SmtB family transcription factor n=1 Tax=Pseudoruegeria sp. HB172150 TaxID=2721164 RepID=UPI0015529C08|nr:helix-turn-helix domain-containing protein [Pseudoruegeria sp. HB172150]